MESHLPPPSFLHMAQGGAHLALVGAAGGGQACWHRTLVPRPALPPLRHPSLMHSASPHSLSHPLIGTTNIPSSFTLSSSTADGSPVLSSIFDHRRREESPFRPSSRSFITISPTSSRRSWSPHRLHPPSDEAPPIGDFRGTLSPPAFEGMVSCG